MDEASGKVIWLNRAEISLQKIFLYIYGEAPETAAKFIEKLIEFGDSLGILPEKYPLCRQKSFRKNRFHCAVFHKNYIFVYSIHNDQVILRNIVHASRLR
ncbi:MAG: type II toxin-antitoxin system RelE/ParE family toxin [Bacteroidetes bacterium]|nr:type II toxin-antitoxin system RelE/ParE family toxin [Bacteroidota bacterium]MBU1718733.1 type II toxin-antitoxin system RelE/ParE family toxin [Bacteroidota bacterium]